MIMKLPNGYGSVVKLSGKRRKPYIERKTVGFHYDEKKDKQVQDYIIIGYAKTKAEGLKILSDYNGNPYDITLSKMTFSEVYNEWSKRKFETIESNDIAFDHQLIIADAIMQLRKWMTETKMAFRLLPEKLTQKELQQRQEGSLECNA